MVGGGPDKTSNEYPSFPSIPNKIVHLSPFPNLKHRSVPKWEIMPHLGLNSIKLKKLMLLIAEREVLGPRQTFRRLKRPRPRVDLILSLEAVSRKSLGSKDKAAQRFPTGPMAKGGIRGMSAT